MPLGAATSSELDSVGDGYTTADRRLRDDAPERRHDRQHRRRGDQNAAGGHAGGDPAGRTLHAGGRSVGTLLPAKNADGTPAQITVGGATHTFSSFQFNPAARFQADG